MINLLYIIFIVSMLHYPSQSEDIEVIVHSDMTYEESLEGSKAPKEILDAQRLVNVQYFNFEGKLCRGQIVVHKDLEQEVVELFDLIKATKFPVKSVIPIVKYDWSDDNSMDDNNTSGFNYRFVAGTKRLSNHSYGKAIDINPFNNPAVYNDGRIAPKNGVYDKNSPGTIASESVITKFLIEKGWEWGGNWNSLKDYQHFDKK